MSTNRYLVATDIDAVQAYIFGSLRMHEIIGASRRLRAHDEKTICKSARRFNGEVLYNAGGSAVVHFPDEDAAREFCRDVERTLIRQTRTARVSTSEPVSFAPSDGGFGEVLHKALLSLERRKRLGHAEGEDAEHPLAHRCDSCGLEAAVKIVLRGTDKLKLGPSCLLKHRWGGKRHDHLHVGFEPQHLPNDFDELAGGDRWALVLADANGVGERLRSLTTAEQYQKFSNELKHAIKYAIDAALNRAAKGYSAAENKKLPIRVLFAGGDDIALVCRGPLALPLCLELVTAFGEKAGPQATWTGGGALGLSAAAVLAHVGFPLRTVHALARRLLGHAKGIARARKWPEGAVDFALSTQSSASADALLEDRIFESEEDSRTSTVVFSGAPYRATAHGQYSLGSFQKACEALRGFPRSKLFELRELASAARYRVTREMPSHEQVEAARNDMREHVSAWRDRLRRTPDAQEKWKDACRALKIQDDGFWARDDEEHRTPVGDLADGLYLWGQRP